MIMVGQYRLAPEDAGNEVIKTVITIIIGDEKPLRSAHVHDLR